MVRRFSRRESFVPFVCFVDMSTKDMKSRALRAPSKRGFRVPFPYLCNLCDSWLFFFGCGGGAISPHFNSLSKNLDLRTLPPAAALAGSFYGPQSFCLSLLWFDPERRGPRYFGRIG